MNQLAGFFLGFTILILLVMAGIGFMSGPTSLLAWFSVAGLVAMPLVYQRLAQRRYIRWEESYSVGVEQMDSDHKKLIQLINNVQTAILYQTDSSFVQEALDELVDYTKTHFQREEELMAANGYPDLEVHKRQHAEMIAKMSEIYGRYLTAPDETLKELLDYLKKWLVNHICGTDQQYGPYLNRKGIK